MPHDRYDTPAVPDTLVPSIGIVQPPPYHAIEISQNAKGMPQVSVRLHGADAQQTAMQALSLYRQLTHALEAGTGLAGPGILPGPVGAEEGEPF